MDLKKAILIFFGSIVVISIGMAFLGFDMKSIDIVIPWVASAGLSLIFSAIAGLLVEASGLGWLKGITLNVPVFDTGIHIPITLFTIATFLVKGWLF